VHVGPVSYRLNDRAQTISVEHAHTPVRYLTSLSDRSRTMATTTTTHFQPELFEFLAELKQNNRRDWFEANKQRYVESVQEPLLRFIMDFGQAIQSVSSQITADPRRNGGSMFRIYRDTRFAKDKSPYKTAAAAHFRHSAAAKTVSVPGFYLHLEPGESFGGGGIYHPEPEALKQVRDRIVAKPKEWKAVREQIADIQGDALKRPPAGYPADHPFIEDLKRKDLYTMVSFTDAQVCSSDFLEQYVAACTYAAPLVGFVSKALSLRW
jgi:uncharacterized protein (TIGR02453 family)